MIVARQKLPQRTKMQPEVLQVRTSGHLLFMADTMNVALTTGRAGILPV